MFGGNLEQLHHKSTETYGNFDKNYRDAWVEI